jgi:hypothetical protein
MTGSMPAAPKGPKFARIKALNLPPEREKALTGVAKNLARTVIKTRQASSSTPTTTPSLPPAKKP